MKMKTIILLMALVSMLSAQDYEFYNEKLTDKQNEQAIYLEKNLMATCCFGGPVYMHGKNQMTEDAKITIRRLLIEGKSTDDVLDHFRNSIDSRTKQPYGNRILASPKASETVGKVSYWMVVLFSLIGLGILGLALKKLQAKKQDSDPKIQLSDETLNKIESELSDLD
ncbi:MAG: cytochrome c-type biogenesis protein CcmH [FCB group bacterium]|nr:cytochrome c-type biogenesis protein CcmH [FCB group bacterium]MBL7028620.1 cytochrome c-type biogenesis protein CcmH [Candidatus Neomarinimicrobiota bacterium]MBL7121806.1 cytochrome c-type biogenesis protein CcmH [Candidatus Neomarinimicrobiota bacterium]